MISQWQSLTLSKQLSVECFPFLLCMVWYSFTHTSMRVYCTKIRNRMKSLHRSAVGDDDLQQIEWFGTKFHLNVEYKFKRMLLNIRLNWMICSFCFVYFREKFTKIQDHCNVIDWCYLTDEWRFSFRLIEMKVLWRHHNV